MGRPAQIWNEQYGWKNENWRKWWNGLAPKPTGSKAKPKKGWKRTRR